LSWDDVAVDTATEAYRLRREMEKLFAPARERAAMPSP
jgi:predicted homoserine dehydrogenase-like protein